jgi:hypothetical protein
MTARRATLIGRRRALSPGGPGAGQRRERYVGGYDQAVAALSTG